jgi:hypothetical protein
MKLVFVVFASALVLSAAAPQTQAKKADQPPKAAAKVVAKAAPKLTDASKPTAVPADAVLGADGDYRYTDPQGKKWIYRKTPFGVTRLEDSAERSPAQVVTAAGIKATEDGDKVHFERQGPFGLWKWDKNKSELDETEKAALQNSQAANKTASK